MSDKKEAVNWRRRLARWEKNPPEVPIALGPVISSAHGRSTSRPGKIGGRDFGVSGIMTGGSARDEALEMRSD